MFTNRLLFIIIAILVFSSCSKQYKAEKSVYTFMSEHYSGYKSVGFGTVECFKSNGISHYKISHGYRLYGKEVYHTFTLSAGFNIESYPFENFEQ